MNSRDIRKMQMQRARRLKKEKREFIFGILGGILMGGLLYGCTVLLFCM